MGVIVSDPFTEASNTNLTAHTPNTAGTGWTEEVKTGTAIARVNGTNDNCEPDGDENNDTILYSAQPNPSVVEYDVEFDVAGVPGAGGASRKVFLVGRYQDASNMYCVEISIAGQNPDRELHIISSGSPTSLATADLGDPDGLTQKLEIKDATKKYYESGTEQMSSTNNDITAAGKAGVAWGALVDSSDDINSGWIIDNFIVTEQGAAPAATRVPQMGLTGVGL